MPDTIPLRCREAQTIERAPQQNRCSTLVHVHARGGARKGIPLVKFGSVRSVAYRVILCCIDAQAGEAMIDGSPAGHPPEKQTCARVNEHVLCEIDEGRMYIMAWNKCGNAVEIA